MRIATPLLPLLTMVTACAIGGDADEPAEIASALSGTASVSLKSASTAVTQTGDTAWTLTKTGGLSGNTVTWNVTATKGASQAGHLVIQGTMTVTNSGTGPATIGNIVVNLQRKSGNTWKTASSDIADATNGDDATSAKIHAAASSENRSSFTENSASGHLNFMDATNNTVFSLVPQIQIPAGATRSLLFSAEFDNNVLAIPAGTQIRAETIVSFGNATANGNSTPNVDINGNGTIDTDEARVRSVPSRIPVTVPAQVNGNSSNVTLSDTLADIASTGTVTFSNVQFNLGASGGTVTATVAGGTDGGSITNCAHLTSPDQTISSGGFVFVVVPGLDLQSCSTVDVGGSGGGGGGGGCTAPGQAGCGWSDGDLVTYGQTAWGTSGSTASNLLTTQFGPVYFSANGILEVGIAGTAGTSIQFTSGSAIAAYLPASGTATALTNDVADPTFTSSGILGGVVTALALDVDFSAAGKLVGTSGLTFGSLSICGVTGLANTTVAGFLGLAETALGGGSTSGLTYDDIVTIATDVTLAFASGTPSSFAQTHLVNGACP